MELLLISEWTECGGCEFENVIAQHVNSFENHTLTVKCHLANLFTEGEWIQMGSNNDKNNNNKLFL